MPDQTVPPVDAATDAPTDAPTDVATRRCWGVFEPLHVVAYLAEGPRAALAELGLLGRRGYFAQRAAPLGPVDAPVVVATFYVFAPDLVARAMPSVWQQVTPEQVTRTRYAAVGDTLRTALADPEGTLPDLTELLTLARAACAGLSAPGRALYAAHAGLPWPEDPLLQLWHASALLREYRGDGHLAALLQADLDPVEALITDGLTSGNLEFVRTTRGWTDAEWVAGYRRLRDRGLVDDDAPGTARLTDAGRELRARVEAATDANGRAGWAGLGAAGCDRFVELARPLRARLRESGMLPGWLFGPARG